MLMHAIDKKPHHKNAVNFSQYTAMCGENYVSTD